MGFYDLIKNAFDDRQRELKNVRSKYDGISKEERKNRAWEYKYSKRFLDYKTFKQFEDDTYGRCLEYHEKKMNDKNELKEHECSDCDEYYEDDYDEYMYNIHTYDYDEYDEDYEDYEDYADYEDAETDDLSSSDDDEYE